MKHKQYFEVKEEHIQMLKLLYVIADEDSIMLLLNKSDGFYVTLAKAFNIKASSLYDISNSDIDNIDGLWAQRITALQIFLSTGSMKVGRYWNNGINNVWKKCKNITNEN